MGQLYTSQKSKLNGNINAMNYFTNMLQEADKRVKRNTVNEPLFYKDEKSTKNLRRSILADRKLFPAKSTKAEKDRIVAKHLRAYKEVFSQNGEPGINIGENIIARTHYNEPDNTIELARASSKKLLEELSHAKQNKEGKSVWLSTAADWIANPYFTNKGQRKMYNRPGTTEYEAHKEIEPQLRKDYKDILERNEDYEKYRNYVDNSESDYKFEMGGSMYKTIPEYEKARSIYEAEKGKAGTYNDFQTELYTQAGRTRGTSETPRQLGDMFNTLSPAQQDALATKYKAEFIPSTTPSSTRRNYINSMEMNVPGKGTGYYSFPTNDVVYGTKAVERPMLQMDRIQVPQAKPVQQLSAGYKPSMNQRITMPGMKMPATQSTQNMTQPSKTYTSVVDLLNSRKMDSSFSARKKMAEKMGITNYTGTAAQNQALMSSNMLAYGGNMSMYETGGKLSSKYLKMLAYGGVITDDSILEEDQFERPIEPELNYMQAAQYALPKSTVNMKGEPINLPKGTATVDLGNVKADNTTPDNSNLEDMSAVGSIGTQLGAALIGSKAQKKNNPNSTYTYDGQNRTTEGAKGIATGFALGNKIVPGVGGAVGAFAGGIYGIAKGSKMDKQAKLDRGYQDKMFKRSRDLEMEGRQRLQGEQQYGSNTQMYGNGGGGLFDTNKTAFVDSTLNANQNLNFVKRLREPNTPSIQVPGMIGRSTHLMSYDPGSKRVYPEVVQQNGKLVRLEGDAAYDYAENTKEYIPFNSTEKAEWFANNGYKQGTGVLKKANGGNLSSKFLAGLNPAISQTSSSTTEINGKSHEDGGVPIRNMNAEVEKGETTSGDYVFSKRLGFAKIHKPIAKAKGMIEEKPMTASRINSLKLLAEKEQKLSMAQEYIKNTLNLQ